MTGPSTMNCAHSPIAIMMATPARTAVAAGVERVSVAGRTASRPMANSALVAARACVRRIRLTTRVAGTCATTTKRVLMRKTTPISPGPAGVCALANGGRMLEKNAPPIITSTMLAAIRMRKSRSHAHPPLVITCADWPSPPIQQSCVQSSRTLDRVKVLCDGRTVADHQRIWAWHQSISDPAHGEAKMRSVTVLPLCYYLVMAVRKKRSISLPPDLDDQIAAAAEQAGVTYSAWLAATARKEFTLRAGLLAVAEYENDH